VLCESVCLLDLHAAFPAPASGSLALALHGALDACAANAASSQVGIEVDEIPVLAVAVDTDRLTLVLVNVIDNAVKHGRPRGGVFIAVDVTEQRFVRITVDDDGPGIGIAERERVFDLGARAVTAAHGNGIGLALVRLLLERAGGRVDLEDSPLGGARFIITLPRG
jgi:signal transduction histidine kinase